MGDGVYPSLSLIFNGATRSELFEYGGILCACFFNLSPMVQMHQVYRSGGSSLATVNPNTLILIFFNSTLWLIYGAFLPMPPVVRVNIIGGFLGVFYLVCCWSFALRSRSALPGWGKRALQSTLGAIVAAGLVLGYVVTSPRAAADVGNLAMVVNTCLFASPLSVVVQVLKERSSELLPPAQCAMQFLNCCFWVAVGVDRQSLPLLITNSLGLLLACVQLGLIMMFPPTPKKSAVKIKLPTIVESS